MEKRDASMRVAEKENQIRKFDELIKQSEDALDKIYSNSQKLNEALN